MTSSGSGSFDSAKHSFIPLPPSLPNRTTSKYKNQCQIDGGREGGSNHATSARARGNVTFEEIFNDVDPQVDPTHGNGIECSRSFWNSANVR